MGINLIETMKATFADNQAPSLKGPDFPDGFVISEVVKSQGPNFNVITLALVGNTMPHIPFQWGSEQRIKETWYPGNSEPSVHVLGSKKGPVTVKGRLMDKRQKVSSGGIATAIVDVMDTLCDRGNLLKLKLGGWVRYGYLTKTDFKMRRTASIEYELTFFIVSETEPKQNPILGGKSLPKADNEALARISKQMQDNIAKYPSDFPKGPFEAINSIVNEAAKKIAIVTGAVDQAISAVEQTNAGINRAVGVLAATKAFVAKANQRIGRIVLDNEVRKATFKRAVDYKVMRTAYPKIERQNVSQGYKNVAQIQATQRSMREVQKYVVAIGSQLEAYIKSVPARRHLVKADQTLQSIAVFYYGNAEEWTRIRDHNKLKTTVLVPGSVLEIPK